MILGASSDDNAFRAQDCVASLALQFGAIIAFRKSKGQCLRRGRKLRAETISLKLRTVGQLAPADPSGKAKKILNQRRRSGLPTAYGRLG